MVEGHRAVKEGTTGFATRWDRAWSPLRLRLRHVLHLRLPALWIAGVAIRRSGGSLPDNTPGLQLSKFSPNGLSLRTAERNVEQDHQLARGSTPWECLNRLQQERHRALRNFEIRRARSKHAKPATDSLLTIVIMESAAVFGCKERACRRLSRQLCAIVQGSTTSTPVPSKSRTFLVTRTAPRDRDMAAI